MLAARKTMPDLKIVLLPAYARISGNTVLIQRATTILQIWTIGRGMDSYHENIFSEKNPRADHRLYSASLFRAGGFR